MREKTATHVYPESVVIVNEHERTQWVEIDGVTVFCKDSTQADRLSEVFAQLGNLMRERAHLPEPDAGEDELEHARRLA